MKTNRTIYINIFYSLLFVVVSLILFFPIPTFSQNPVENLPLADQLVWVDSQISNREQELTRIDTAIQEQQSIIADLDNGPWWQPQFNYRSEAEKEIRRLTEERNIVIDQQIQLNRFRNEVQLQINQEEIELARQEGDTTRVEELERDNIQIGQTIEENIRQREEHLNQSQIFLQSDPYSIQNQTADRGTCVSVWSGIDIDACIANGIDAFYGIIIWLLSWLLWLTDTLFSTIIKLTIIDFKGLLDQLNVIDLGWSTARNIANVFFIFILLYLAISTVLQLSGVDTRKMLVNIIIIALVINFSAVFTRIAIDASNVTAVTFYNLLGTEGNTPDLSAYFRNALSWFEGRSVGQGSGPQASGFTQTTIGSQTLAAIAKNSGMLILLVITIFTLLAASLLLLIRAVSLIILIIVSPLAFLGYGFKPLAEIFSLWLKRLKCDVLYAPLFFFLLYITFGLFQGIYSTQEGRTSNNVADHIIMFLILNGLMLGSIFIAQKVGCQIGNKSFDFVTKRSKQALGGIAGATGRNTLGRGAKAIQQSDRLKNLATKDPRLAKLSWAAGAAAEKVAGFGFGSNLSFEGRTDQRQKRQAEQLKNLKNPNLKAKYLSNLSTPDAKKQYGDMSDRDKADIEINAISEGNTEMVNVMRGLREDLKGEKKENANKEYEKQLQKFLKIATKDYTDANGNEVKKGDQLSIAQQLEKFETISQTFVKDKANPTAEEKEAGRKLQQETYNALSDADKVAITKEAENMNKTNPSLENKQRLDTLKEFETEYIKGRSETEQKFYDEKEKVEKRIKKQALNEAKRDAKLKIDRIFENQNKATYELNEDNLNHLKENMAKLNSDDVAGLDKDILRNKQVQELFDERDIPKIVANTENIDRGTLSEIVNNVLDNPNINNSVKAKIDPKFKDSRRQPQINPVTKTPSHLDASIDNLPKEPKSNLENTEQALPQDTSDPYNESIKQ